MKTLWKSAYRQARLMNYGPLHCCFHDSIARLAKSAAEFRRGIHGGHRDFTFVPSSLRYRLHLRKSA